MEKTEILTKPFSKDDLIVPDRRTLIVALEYPAPYNSLTTAILYANAYLEPSFTNPVKIKLAPGTYIETPLQTVPVLPGTIIEGASAFATQIFLATPQFADPYLSVSGYCEIRDIQLTGGRIENKDGGGTPIPPNANNTLIYMEPVFLNALVVSNSGFSGAETIIQCDAPGGIIGFSGAWGIFSTPFDTSDANPNNWTYLTFDIGIHINSSARCVLTGTGAITNDIVTQGLIFLGGFQVQPFQYAVLINNSGILDMTGISVEAGLTAIRSDGAESVHIVGGSLLNNVSHLEVANTGTFSSYSLQTVNNPILNFVLQDLTIEDATSQVISIGSNFDSQRLILPADKNNIILQYGDYNLDNERGFHNLGSFISGDPEFPTETYLGQGSTNVKSLSVLKFNSVAMIFTDVTNSIIPSGTTVTIFDDLVGGEFYIGTDYDSFSGFNCEINTILDLGAGELVTEYWNTGTVSWTEFNQMSSQHLIPHASYTNMLFSVAESQDIRFDANINLGQVAINSITKYWIRIRIVSTITTSPVLSQLKPYGDFTLATSTGFLLYYGKARPKTSIPFDFSFIDAQGVTSPVDTTIYISKQLQINRVYNGFNPNDEATAGFYVPPNLDSSTAIDIVFSFFSNGVDITPFEFELRYGCFGEGQPLFLTSAAAPAAPAGNETALTVMLTPNGNLTVTTTVQIDVSLCRASINGEITESLFLKLLRIANGNSDRIIFTNIGFYQTTYINGLSQSE